MAKFTDKQVLQLMLEVLRRRLKFYDDYPLNSATADLQLAVQKRTSLIKHLIENLEFYSSFEFD